MHKVTVDRIVASIYPEEERPESKEYLLLHVPDQYKRICGAIHHVDTNLCKCPNSNDACDKVFALMCPEGKFWRVQGYLTKKDIDTLMVTWDTFTDLDFTSTMSFSEGCIEIWTAKIPYIK